MVSTPGLLLLTTQLVLSAASCSSAPKAGKVLVVCFRFHFAHAVYPYNISVHESEAVLRLQLEAGEGIGEGLAAEGATAVAFGVARGVGDASSALWLNGALTIRPAGVRWQQLLGFAVQMEQQRLQVCRSVWNNTSGASKQLLGCTVP